MTAQELLELALRGGRMMVERMHPYVYPLDVRISPSRRYVYLSSIRSTRRGGPIECLSITNITLHDSPVEGSVPHVDLHLPGDGILRLRDC